MARTRTYKTTKEGNQNPWCTCCRVSSAVEGKTKLSTPRRDAQGDAIKWHICSGTLLQQHHEVPGKLCDFVIKRTWRRDELCILAELKGRVAHVRDIVEQLQAGANMLQCPAGSVRAVLVKSRGIGPTEIKVLANLRVIYGGRRVPIVTVNSGYSLAGMP